MFRMIFVLSCIMMIQVMASIQLKPTEKVNIVSEELDQIPLQKSFLMGRDSYKKLISSYKKNMVLVNNQHDLYDFERACPSKTLTEPNVPPNKRSACPWFYSFHHNPKQHPATIVNAERMCEYSIGSNKSLECVPVTHKIRVLQLQNDRDKEDNFIWTEIEKTVVVGYTSAARRSDYNWDTHTHVKPEFE